MKKFLLGLTFLFCGFPSLFAQSQPVLAKFFVEGGAEFGGDELLKVTFTTGGTQTMHLGQGGYIAAGGEFSLPGKEEFFVRASLGYKYTTTAAENVDLKLTRVPVTVLFNFMADPKIRLGAGLTTHLGAKFSGGGVLNDIEFETSIGPRVEISYMGIGVQATQMNYSLPNGRKLSANSIGFSYSFAFK